MGKVLAFDTNKRKTAITPKVPETSAIDPGLAATYAETEKSVDDLMKQTIDDFFKTKERMAKDRAKSNASVLRSHRLKD